MIVKWLITMITEKKIIRIGFGLAISAFFLWLVFRNIPMHQVWDSLQSLDIIWIVPAVFVYFAGVWVRTCRWGILMRPVKHCSTARFFPIYVISYMANNILPMRIGDLYRAYIIGKKEKVSKSASLVTIGVERIFDGLTMLVLLLISILLFPIEHEAVRQTVQIGSVLFLGSILTCYILLLKKDWAGWLFSRILNNLPAQFHSRLNDLFNNFFHGLDALRGGYEILLVSCLSLVTWLIEAASYYLVLNAFGFFGPFHVAIATMALVNLMIIVPAAPGYFGPFEWACFIILGNKGYGSLTGFTQEIAAAYALVLHVVVQWIPSTLLGLIFMWTEHVSFHEIDSDDEGGYV
ncbi:flippase-like domain-containing protein [bacterium]|nr:flippase-like domain-containing protein [candidate division CSSED10-310 bacterium]